MSVHYTCPNHPSENGGSSQPVNQGCNRHYGPCHVQGENRKNLPDFATYLPKEEK
jgi:hypothetical protein